MVKKALCILCCIALLGAMTAGCTKPTDSIKIGVSLGVGPAARWVSEQGYMEEYAQEQGVGIEVRLNKGDGEKTQEQDCKELIDSGIDVLILTPRNVNEVSEIIRYANSKKVPVISYARLVQNEKIALYVGYDSNKIGQRMGQYLSELVYKGDYIFLRGDLNDQNAIDLHNGAMRYLNSIKDSINVILDADVPNWDPATAKTLVKEAIQANGNRVDAILAPNDKIAGACVEALQELNVTTPVAITGMDAELDAVKRILAGTQDITSYLDLRELATSAMVEAINLASNKPLNTNGEVDNQTEKPIPAHLVAGELVTKLNIDRILIDSGFYTKEEVYGK